MKQKPWEATISVWIDMSDGWRWQVQRDQDSEGPAVHAWNTKACKTRGSALRAARRVMTRLGLVERKT